MMVAPPVTELMPCEEMFVLQAQLGEWDNLNHLLVCNATAKAVLIDPFSAEFWVEQAKARGFEITTVALTHSHWDHTKGVERLLELSPATSVLVHERESLRGWRGPDTARWNHPPLTSVPLEVGELSFEVHCTPGHTPGHVTLIGHGAVVSGDCLFLGRCGRTDLFGGDMRMMWESQMHLNDILSELPSDWLVLPGHQYALEDGSNPTHITVGELLLENPAIAKQSFQQFSRLDFLGFEDSLAEKARREQARASRS